MSQTRWDSDSNNVPFISVLMTFTACAQGKADKTAVTTQSEETKMEGLN